MSLVDYKVGGIGIRVCVGGSKRTTVPVLRTTQKNLYSFYLDEKWSHEATNYFIPCISEFFVE